MTLGRDVHRVLRSQASQRPMFRGEEGHKTLVQHAPPTRACMAESAKGTRSVPGNGEGGGVAGSCGEWDERGWELSLGGCGCDCTKIALLGSAITPPPSSESHIPDTEVKRALTDRILGLCMHR